MSNISPLAYESELPLKKAEDTSLPTLLQQQTLALENQTKALTLMAEAIQGISTFLAKGLPQVLNGYSKAQSVHSVLNGLVSNSGRAGLDPRVHKQNAVDAIHLIETFYTHYKDLLEERAKGVSTDEVKDPAVEVEAWLNQKTSGTSQPE